MNRKELDEAWGMMLETTISLDEAKSAVNDALLEFEKALKGLRAVLAETGEEGVDE